MRNVQVAVLGGGITGQMVQWAVPQAELYDWSATPALGQRAVMTRAVGANYLWEPIAGIPCKEFTVVTEIDGQPPTEALVRAYKNKIGKMNDVDGWERQFQWKMQGFEFEHLPPAVIHYKHRVSEVDRNRRIIYFEGGLEPVCYETLVSTVPLFALVDMLRMPPLMPRMFFKPIYVKVSGRPPEAPYPRDIMYVNYLTSDAVPPYRYCDRFGERHYESVVPYEQVATRVIKPGKIFPHNGVPDLLSVLESFNIFTFGRFGSWAPDELVHETWRRIELWKEALVP